MATTKVWKSEREYEATLATRAAEEEKHDLRVDAGRSNGVMQSFLESKIKVDCGIITKKK